MNQLRPQLQELGYFAARNKDFSVNSPKCLDMTRELKSQSQTLNASLAKALSDVLSFVVASDSNEPYLKKTALIQAKSVIKELAMGIERSKGQSLGTECHDLEDFCISFISNLAEFSCDPPGTVAPNLVGEVDRKMLENDSVIMLRTAEKVSTLLEHGYFQELIPNANGKDSHLQDFTPGAICLAKVFEKEINLSVVHWVREQLGVNLPPFFNRYQEGISATLVTSKGPRQIDFNKNRQGKWLAPGLGESLNACLELAKTGIPREFDETSWDTLLKIWSTVQRKRNDAAHTEVVDFESFNVIRDALAKVVSERLLDKFYSMKQRYKGSTEIQTVTETRSEVHGASGNETYE